MQNTCYGEGAADDLCYLGSLFVKEIQLMGKGLRGCGKALSPYRSQVTSSIQDDTYVHMYLYAYINACTVYIHTYVQIYNFR